MKQPELYHTIKDDEPPVWFLVLIYTLTAFIIMGSIAFFWIATP